MPGVAVSVGINRAPVRVLGILGAPTSFAVLPYGNGFQVTHPNAITTTPYGGGILFTAGGDMAFVETGAGTYPAKINGSDTSVVVPAAAIAIDQASLNTGATATLTHNQPPGTTYQWQLDGSNISGATGDSYTTAATGELTCIATRPGGETSTTAAVTVSAVPSGAATIDSVVVGAYSAGEMPTTLTATGATGTDTGYWALEPEGDADPTAAAIKANSGTYSDNGSFVWTGTPAITLADGLPRGNYKLHVVNDNGELSNVGRSAAFLLSTTAPILSLPTASVDGSAINWGVTSDLAAGTIHVGVYPSSASEPPASDIIGQTGDVAYGETYATPTADDQNTGTISGIADGEYKVAKVQVDDFGNISAVAVVAGTLTVSGATDPATEIPTIAGSDLQVLLDYTDKSTMWQTTSRTGSVATDDPVRYFDDLSSHHNDFKATAALTPGNAIAKDGYVHWNNAGIPVDGSHDNGDTSFQNGGYGFTNNMDVYALFALNGDTALPLFGHNSNGAIYAAVMESGNSSTTVNGTISGTIRINGEEQVSPTRASLYTKFVAAANASGYAVLSIHGVDLTGIKRSAFMPFGMRFDDGYRGDVNAKYLVVTEAQSASNIDDIVASLLGDAN